MSQTALTTFLESCNELKANDLQPADAVKKTMPLMVKLLEHADEFIKPEHLEANDDHYARHPIFICDEGQLSLFSMVWKPGQWTGVHDHGTWGVVAILSGHLAEQNYLRTDHKGETDSGIVLKEGGLTILPKGAVTSFVPNPDHIHKTGVPSNYEKTVSLHLYGREMKNCNAYDIEKGIRQPMQLEYN